MNEDYAKSTTVNYTVFNVLEELEKNDYPQYRYLYFTLPILLNARVVVETGFALGHSTRIWLEALKQLTEPETRFLYTYEINCAAYEQVRVGILEAGLANCEGAASWKIQCEDSTRSHYQGATIDLLYLDSDHCYETVSKELATFTPHLSSRALILTHDSWPAVKEAQHPSDTYRALKDWADKNGWRTLLFTFPEGVTLLYRAKS